MLRPLTGSGSVWQPNNLATWRNGAFKCRPRNRWIGWKPAQQFDRLDLIANNTRFLVLSNPGVLRNFASYFLGQMTRQLPDNWFNAFGRQVLLAETFCDPKHFKGKMYTASNGINVGKTNGFARYTGNYTDPHGRQRDMYVKPLRKDATRLLAQQEPLPVTVRAPPDPSRVPQDVPSLRSLYSELETIPDARRSQGKKHSVASVLTTPVFAELTNMKGCMAAADFALLLTQKQLRVIGVWKSPKTRKYLPVSKSTLSRVLQSVLNFIHFPHFFENSRMENPLL